MRNYSTLGDNKRYLIVSIFQSYTATALLHVLLLDFTVAR